MHTGPTPEAAGEFVATDVELYDCYGCNQRTAKAELWESSCGGYEDVKYTCTDPKCGKVRWVDGCDS